jgi:uncharacterized membrane protein YfcA
LPIVIGLAPGVALGTMLVSQVSPAWLKFVTFIVLLPLILLQAAGYRRPIKSEKLAACIFGGALGVLYSVTTISGPPLAVAAQQPGVTRKTSARARASSVCRVHVHRVAYYYAGLLQRASFRLIPYILPSIFIGVPIGPC